MGGGEGKRQNLEGRKKRKKEESEQETFPVNFISETLFTSHPGRSERTRHLTEKLKIKKKNPHFPKNNRFH